VIIFKLQNSNIINESLVSFDNYKTYSIQFYYKIYGRHCDLVNSYGKSVSQMTRDMFRSW